MAIKSIVPGIISLLFTISIYRVIFPSLSSIIDEQFQYVLTSESFNIFSFKNYYSIVVFLFSVYATSMVIGYFFYKIVLFWDLDTKVGALRFKNKWHYIFSGRLHKLKKYQHLSPPHKAKLYVNVDALVQAPEGTYLYSGEIVDYHLKSDQTHELSQIVLRDAIRYKKTIVDDVEKRIPISIPTGQLFVLECDNLINLNCIYVYEKSERDITSIRNLFIFLVIEILGFIYILEPFFGLPAIDVIHNNHILPRLLYGRAFIEFINIWIQVDSKDYVKEENIELKEMKLMKKIEVLSKFVMIRLFYTSLIIGVGYVFSLIL